MHSAARLDRTGNALSLGAAVRQVDVGDGEGLVCRNSFAGAYLGDGALKCDDAIGNAAVVQHGDGRVDGSADCKQLPVTQLECIRAYLSSELVCD